MTYFEYMKKNHPSYIYKVKAKPFKHHETAYGCPGMYFKTYHWDDNLCEADNCTDCWNHLFVGCELPGRFDCKCCGSHNSIVLVSNKHELYEMCEVCKRQKQTFEEGDEQNEM